MDFKEYNKFVEIVKEQIECAKETTKILQESHRDLHKVGSNFPIRRPQQNQQQQQQVIIIYLDLLTCAEFNT